MRKKRPYIFVIHLTLLAYMFAGLVDLKEVVLCFGEDGHVAVEQASPVGHCEVPATQGQEAALAVAVAELPACHCGPCVDVALATFDAPSIRPLSLQDLIPAPQLFALSAPPFLWLAQCPASIFGPGSVPAAAKVAPPILRSVVLLI